MFFIKNIFKSNSEKIFEQNVLKYNGFGVYCKNIFTRKHIFYILDNNSSISDLPFYLIADSPNNETYSLIDNKKRWYKNGKRHRDNDLPAVIDLDDDIYYYCKYGKYHRLDGPAIHGEPFSDKWYLYGKQYENVKDWLKHHPNQENTFQTTMTLRYS
jgi:hypothetical protein